MTRFSTLLISFASLVAVACAPAEGLEGDIPVEDGAVDLGKADAVALPLTPIQAPISVERREAGGRAIITSAASWEDYFGTEAPASIDFDREWVAFYGAGLRNTGGYAAEIVGLHALSGGGLLLETRHTSPGFDCIVTQAFTWPHAVVSFPVPSPAPTWALGDHEDTVQNCSPTPAELQAQLADSLAAWQAARDAHGNSYTYSQVMSSFIGLDARTTFVVENGVVVERHYKEQLGDQVTTWSEVGAEVGSHTDEGHPVALVDDLYAECASEVLTRDPQEHFINLSFDDAGLLRTCTSFHRLCNDDCDRGPKLGFIEF